MPSRVEAETADGTRRVPTTLRVVNGCVGRAGRTQDYWPTTWKEMAWME